MSSPHDTIQDMIDKIKELEAKLEERPKGYCATCESYNKGFCENALSTMQATKPNYSCNQYD